MTKVKKKSAFFNNGYSPVFESKNQESKAKLLITYPTPFHRKKKVFFSLKDEREKKTRTPFFIWL